MERPRRSVNNDAIYAIRTLAWELSNQQKYAEAEEVGRAALEVMKNVLGCGHPDALSTMYNLARDLSSQQKYFEAEKLGRVALEGRKKVLGSDHPSTLSTMHDLTIYLSKQQKYVEAEKFGQAALEGRKKVLGSEHSDTLSTMHNLAIDLSSQQKYVEAEEFGRAVLEGRKKRLGSDHSDTLSSMVNLATDLSNQQKFAEAEEFGRAVLEGCKKILGPDHPGTLWGMHNLSVDLINQQKYVEAEEFGRAVLKGRRNVLGFGHPDTFSAMLSLASSLYHQQKFIEAEELGRAALEGRKKVLGSDHPDTLWSIHNLAVDLRNQHKFVEAEELSRAVLEGRRKALGLNHPDTLWTIHNLASDLSNQEKYVEAEKLGRAALDGRKKVLGLNHPDTLWTMHNLAHDLRNQHKFVEAEEFSRAALEGRESALGSEHPTTLSTMHDLAIDLRNQQKYAEAEEFGRAAMEGSKKVLGSDHIDTLWSMQNLAYDLSYQQKFVEAEELGRAVLEGRKKKLGSDHPDTLSAMYSLATDLYNQEKYFEAEKLDREILKSQTTVFGPNHQDTVEYTASLALTLYRQNKYDEVHELDECILRYRRESPQNAYDFTDESLVRAAVADRSLGRFAAAAVSDAEHVESCREKYGDAHDETIAAMHNYIYDLWIQQKYTEAEPLCYEVLKLENRTGNWSTQITATARTLADIAISQGKLASALEVHEALLKDAPKGSLRTLLAFNIGDLLYTQFESSSNISHLNRAIGAFALSWESLTPETDQQHDPSSSYHNALYRRFYWLHSRSSSLSHCPMCEVLDGANDIPPMDMSVVFQSSTTVFRDSLSFPHTVEYAVVNIDGDSLLVQILLGDYPCSIEFRDQITRWTNVCHPKLPHLYLFATTACTFDGSAFLAFLCPMPDEAKLNKKAVLSELIDVMDLLSKEYPELYNRPEQRQLVLLSIFYRLGSNLQFVSEAQHRFTASLLLDEFDEFQQSLDAPTEVNQTLFTDLLMSFLGGPQNYRSPQLASRAFGALKQVSNKVGFPDVFRIDTSDITDISTQHSDVGGNSSIFRAKLNGMDVAIKVLRPCHKMSKEKLLSMLAHEALIWRFLSHPNLLPFLGCYPEMEACLVTEWMSHGTLRIFLWGHEKCDCDDSAQCAFVDEHRERDRRKLSLQVVKGLTYLHKIAGIVHGDLRADNILVDNKCNVRITDFGLASLQISSENLADRNDTHEDSGPNGSAGAPRWFAPEYLDHVMRKHLPGDVYAWACVLLEIFTGKQPFWRYQHDAVVPVAISRGEKPWILHCNGEMKEAHELGLSQEVASIAEKCWQTDPDSRPDMFAICKDLGTAWQMKWDDPYLY